MRALAHIGTRIRNHFRKPIDISDDYVRWLSFANAGMLDRGNLYCFDHAISHLPSSAPIIEIGSFCGLSTNLLTYYKKKSGVASPLFTCDKWEFEGAHDGPLSEGSSITHKQYRDFTKETFIRNVKMFSGNCLPYTIEKLSDDFFAAWKREEEVKDVFGRSVKLGGPIAFCYIDGNHTYEAAKRDFGNSDEFLQSGGFLLFDDSADGSQWEVCRVIAEIKAGKAYDVVIKNPNYLFRKR